ncbi:MAG: RNA polymerase sigma factor [Acidithiobacillus sp.]|nr:RNA polymerase sigma factor [Acidithiobacillus sp.]
MNRNLPSEALIDRIQRGNEQAFRELYELYKRRAWHFALCSIRDRDLAGDAVQDAFLEVYRTIGNLKHPAAFQSWFYRILYHQVLRHTKRRHQKHTVDLIEDMDMPIDSDPVQDILADEERRQMWRLVNCLDDAMRIPLLLHYLEGFTDREIAETVGSPIGTVKWRIHQAKVQLARMMGEKGWGKEGYGEKRTH